MRDGFALQALYGDGLALSAQELCVVGLAGEELR